MCISSMTRRITSIGHGDPAMIPVLQTLSRRDKNAAVRVAAATAISQIEQANED